MGARKVVALFVKAILTVGVFYLLLSHEVAGADGDLVPIWKLLGDELVRVRLRVLLPFLLVATTLKLVGIFSSMLRWHLLLIAQGIRFNLGHIVGSFLIGRFLGTFLPSTLGLDGYKLYDAARFSGQAERPAAALAVEKVMGLCGIVLTFLFTLPFGYRILGARASLAVAVVVPLALLALGSVLVLLLRPALVERFFARASRLGGGRFAGFLARFGRAAAAYEGRVGLLAMVLGLSFMVHFLTAAMYYFTMFAVGGAGATFFEVAFASSVQIFATVISPFTIAGEGVREVVQALLLSQRIGVGVSVLSGALGFWSAEALTLVGGFFLWARPADYRPKRCDTESG